MKQEIIDNVKIRIYTHDPPSIHEYEFDNIDDALNFLSMVRKEYPTNEEIDLINGTLYHF
jgi:hypothetical protein